MENWRKRYDEAQNIYEKYFRPEFERIYIHLLEQDIPIEDILEKEKITYSEELSTDFKKCTEAYEQGCEAMKQGLMLVEQYCENGSSIIEAVEKAGIKDEDMYSMALALSEITLKENIIFNNLKIEDESIDDLLMSDGYECNYSICSYYKKMKYYNIENNTSRYVIERLNEICSFVKENSKRPVKIENMITRFMMLSIFTGDDSRLVLIIQGLLEWIEKIGSLDSDASNEDAQILYKWLLKQATHIYYNYHLHHDQHDESNSDIFFYSTDIGHIIKEQETTSSLNNENDNNEHFKVDNEIVTKTYNKCNGEQWEDITISEFLILLNSNGENQNLIIRRNETNRTKCIFRKIANTIENKETRKTWIEGIKRHIFNDVDFMKATLQTNKYSAGYSETDANFKPFLASL